jgi:hypothetical protein
MLLGVRLQIRGLLRESQRFVIVLLCVCQPRGRADALNLDLVRPIRALLIEQRLPQSLERCDRVARGREIATPRPADRPREMNVRLGIRKFFE